MPPTRTFIVTHQGRVRYIGQDAGLVAAFRASLNDPSAVRVEELVHSGQRQGHGPRVRPDPPARRG